MGNFFTLTADDIEPEPALDPCPHCGGTAEMRYGNDSRGSMDAGPSYHVITCSKCGASGGKIHQHYDAPEGHTKAEAAKSWNWRSK